MSSSKKVIQCELSVNCLQGTQKLWCHHLLCGPIITKA